MKDIIYIVDRIIFWVNSLVNVEKCDGFLCFSLDFRGFNKVICWEYYRILIVEGNILVSCLSGKKFFFILDEKLNGFW